MSIAEQQRQINEILTNSKQRLRAVEEKGQMLSQQRVSIDEDITILTHRAQLIRQRLLHKKQAYKTVSNLTAQAEQAYRKLKQSTKLLLTSLKKESKKIDQVLGDGQDQP